MLTDYGFIGLFLIASVLLAGLMLFVPFLLRLIKIVPHHPSSLKNSTFECGMPAIGKSWVRFNFRYYFYALIFLILDVVLVILFPWAAASRQLGWAAYFLMLFILAVLAVAVFYAWKKKALEWQ